MTNKKSCLAILLLLLEFTSGGQTLIILPTIRLPRDSATRTQLVASLNDFLAQVPKQNKDNTLVLEEDLLATSALLDEMKNLGKNNNAPDENFYKPYLTNLVPLNSADFLIQLLYIGVKQDTPIVRAGCTLLAHKINDKFYFRSPLKQNTINWKTDKIGHTTIYFKNNFNDSNAHAYFNRISDYDKRLNAPDIPGDFYCADNFPEALHLIGIDYKSDYNGRAHSYLTSKENNQTLNVNGALTSDFTRFDPHDLWHDRLHNILSADIINWPVDEGSAYLYGGSWGLSWTEILHRFKAFADANPNADWVTLYNQSKNFDEKSRFPLNVDFVINALMIQKIENDKGFPAVVELLSCGKQEPNNRNYFNALQHITGISESNFNTAVWKLIRSS
jgi:hypothetical protein